MKAGTEAGLTSRAGLAVPLLGVELLGEVVADRAMIKVRQRYRNDEARPIEAVYTFPLPSDATLMGFAMTCAGRRIEGVVKEREQAFRDYDDALAAGHGAALVDQERANVFSASVGNLLPGEETLVEVSYLQRLTADEGAIRLMIPTLVAPRYIPGRPEGDRTGHGTADPTAIVPDADRITPPIGSVGYALRVDLLFDLGKAVVVESPSHAVVARGDGPGRVRVTLARGDVALDRDLVVITRAAADEPLCGVTIHRPQAGEAGTLALTVVPDLGAAGPPPRQDVVFLMDVSGSMAGASIAQAFVALRLCLRHLREGDRFNVIAFQSVHASFAPAPVPFTQRTLQEVDSWVQAFIADGGTEMLEPLLLAVRQVAHGGVVVLLTDGQVGNEDEILAEVLAARGSARVYTFGIGTNVSDALLRDLARRTGGAVEWIHPGERIDEKVVAQFARATAARVTEVKLRFDGLDVGELAPAELPPLVDGEPWAVYGRVAAVVSGRAELRGKLGDRPFFLSVPVDATAAEDRPLLTKLWAAERVRDLEAVEVAGRHAGRMKERIVQIAVKHGIASRYTSFVVVEERSGDRRATGFPETRVVPVHAPAGWAMLAKPKRVGAQQKTVMINIGAVSAMDTKSGGYGSAGTFDKMDLGRAANRPSGGSAAAEPQADYGTLRLLRRQLASGLWVDVADESAPAEAVRESARAMLALARDGVTTGHSLHGAQLKKAVAAMLALAESLGADDPMAELALLACWLVASGRRTRADVVAAATRLGLALSFDDEPAVRRRAEVLAGS